MSQGLPLAAGEKVIVYALLSQCETPREIMLQLNDGSWEHRAYWGENLIGYGTNGTNSRRRIGDLPAAGQWVRLEVPVEDVGLVGRTLTGMSIDVYGGRVWLDRVGKAAAQSGALGELPTTMISAIAGVTTATTWSKQPPRYRRWVTLSSSFPAMR